MILEPRRVRREEATYVAVRSQAENPLVVVGATVIAMAYHYDPNVLQTVLVGQAAYFALRALVRRF